MLSPAFLHKPADCAAPLREDFYIAVSGQKFLRIVKGLFSKSPLTGVWGGAPPVNVVRGGAPYNTCLCEVRGGAPYNTCRCGARGSAPYISRGARGRASHISVGGWGGAPYVITGSPYTSIILRAGRCPALVIFTFPAHRSPRGYALRGLRRCRLLCRQGLCPLQRLP